MWILTLFIFNLYSSQSILHHIILDPVEIIMAKGSFAVGSKVSTKTSKNRKHGKIVKSLGKKRGGQKLWLVEFCLVDGDMETKEYSSNQLKHYSHPESASTNQPVVVDVASPVPRKGKAVCKGGRKITQRSLGGGERVGCKKLVIHESDEEEEEMAPTMKTKP